jgi:hypothetical protein
LKTYFRGHLTVGEYYERACEADKRPESVWLEP